MRDTARSLILTLLPPTTTTTTTTTTSSYFCRRNLHFSSNYTKPATAFRCLPSAVKLPNFGPTTCIALRPKCSPVRASGQSQQMDGSGSRGTNGLSWVQPILRFAGNNLLPLALVTSVGLGLAYPSLGCAADKYNLSKLGPFGIFVISGLMLRGEEISAALEAFPVGLFGIVSILFLTPYFSRIILQIQLQPQEFITEVLRTIVELSPCDLKVVFKPWNLPEMLVSAQVVYIIPFGCNPFLDPV
ncbi:hypothetical protein PIB30_075073 [Stylosanthes scabra]|uniref:Uncharacterized protein n=1 Tax=Stylosanthes scabra TaxID=79078 RepID=A0ABU6SQL6_9FABA|nr:hypothetical protein [Stylosanthes scabra]